MSDIALSHRIGPPLLAALLVAVPVQAQIVTDGSVGPKVSLSGGEIKIGADLGARRGDNLFHSFEKFGIATGQTATFTGPGDIRNVISRVTGGEVSNIDGKLASTVGQADLYFLNPAGVVFGPNAQLNVPGSFHVSTAHELRFADGTRFSALDKTGSGLTVAPPEAFGFLGKPAGRITSNQSLLEIQPGKTLSLVGGDLELTGGTITVADGSPVAAPTAGVIFNAVSATSPGEVRVTDGAVSAAQLGSIRMADQRITASGDGGTVRIRAGTLTVANSAIDADNTGGWAGTGSIDLMADHLAAVDSRISADTRSAAPGGTITIKAGTMTVSNTDAAGVPDLRGIHSDTWSSGDAGSVEINAGTLELHSTGSIGSDTFSTGQGGLVTVQADRVIINGGGLADFTGITSSTLHKATGTGGEIYITARDLELRDGGAINASTYGQGNAGKVTVKVTHHLLLKNYNTIPKSETRISSRAEGGSQGRAGTVQVNVNPGILEILDGGIIVADSNGFGFAGDVSVDAERLIVANPTLAPPRPARISSRGAATSQGGGSVSVKADVLELRDGGTISTTSLGIGKAGEITVTADKLVISGTGALEALLRSGINSRASQSSQAAGRVSINAGEVEVRDGGEINTESSGNAVGGSIIIKVKDTLRLDNARIQTKTQSTRGGNVSLTVGRLVDLNNSMVTTSVASGEGSGGNIQIKSPLMVVSNSEINANAKGGSGGDIFIDTGQLIRTPKYTITASGSVNGNITIAAPDTDVSSSLTVLPETFFDASSHLPEACAARGGRPGSSFTQGGRGGLPPDPGAPLVSSPFEQPLEQQTATGSPTPSSRPPQATKPIMVSGLPQPVLGSPRLTCR